MAKFPVYESTARPPGVSGQVRRSYDTDTGGAEVGHALQRFGATAFEANSTIFRMQGEAELAEALAADNDAIQQMHLRFEQNADETTYQSDFDETWSSEIAGRELKNGWARREHSLALKRTRAKQQEIVNAAITQRVEQKWKGAYANAKAKAVETGNAGSVRAMLAGYRGMTPEEKELELTKVAHDAELEAFKKYAWRYPLDVIEDLKDDQLEGATLLDADDYLRVRNIAMTRQADDVRQLNLKREQMTQELWDLSVKPNTTSEDVLRFIDGLPNEYFDRTDKEKLFKSEMGRLNLIKKGRGDPLKVRQDYQAYKALLFDAVDGNVTEAEIRKAVNDNQITTGDYQYLNNVLKAKTGSKGEAADLKAAISTSDSIIDDRMGALTRVVQQSGLKEIAKVKVQMLLEDKVRKAAEDGNPMSRDEMVMEAIRIERQVESEITPTTRAEELLPVPERTIRPKAGSKMMNAAGSAIGTYTPQGKVQLNEDGMRQLIRIARNNHWTQQQALDWAAKNGFLVE